MQTPKAKDMASTRQIMPNTLQTFNGPNSPVPSDYLYLQQQHQLQKQQQQPQQLPPQPPPLQQPPSLQPPPPQQLPVSTAPPQQQVVNLGATHQAVNLGATHQAVNLGATHQADLAALFECPVCFDYALPPIIYQCDSGHIICTTCKQKVQCCPSCRGPLGGVRNLAMEKVADSVKFPCRYVGSGCREKMPHVEKRHHEELCPYRPYSCPCPGTTCMWQGGNLELVLSHLHSAHKTITTLFGEDIIFLATDINLPGAVDWVMMQCCFDKHFILVLEKQERPEHDGHQQFFAVVQLIGSAKDAEEFRYKLELVSKDRKLIWEAKPRSIHEGIASVIANTNCLIFETTMAEYFAENGNLPINVTIMKSFQS